MNLSAIVSNEPVVLSTEIIPEPRNRFEAVDPNDYAGTYSTFGGVDMILYCNGSAIGEANRYTIDERDHTLTIVFSLMEANRINQFIEDMNTTHQFLVYYANEYGNQMTVFVDGLSFTGRNMWSSIDSVILEVNTHFSFERMMMFDGRPDEAYAHILPASFFE